MRDTKAKQQSLDQEQTTDDTQIFPFIESLSIDEDYKQLDPGEAFQEF